MNILLKNIVCNGTVSDIYIEGSVIAGIVNSADAPCGQIPASGVEVVDCQGKTAMPAFVNMHTHAEMSLMRGIEEDVQLKDWIDRIWKIESHIDGDFVYHATKVACLEMIRTGTVTFNDQYWYPMMARKAAVEMVSGRSFHTSCLTITIRKRPSSRKMNASGHTRKASDGKMAEYFRWHSMRYTP